MNGDRSIEGFGMPSRMRPARLEDSPEQVADLAAKLNAACGAQLAPRSAVVPDLCFPRTSKAILLSKRNWLAAGSTQRSKPLDRETERSNSPRLRQRSHALTACMGARAAQASFVKC